MKGFVFVVALAFACCVTTCGALKCRTCVGDRTRADCLKEPLTNCSLPGQNVCQTTVIKAAGVETWGNLCSARTVCDIAKNSNPTLCKTSNAVFTCTYCCDTDGCVGQLTGAASAARVSIVTMATAALAVLLKNAAGF
ncbi:U-scoloptoxin(05)-Er3a-like [Branchiostoma lanceolatum]|uniref:U-scoloptoxin(05)-Er3a-like n=1 Tax=Branchiostoma lanceolatum TaxID=7740 RepID=UPI003455A642